MSVRKALVIGVDQYAQAPLRNCVNDASEIAGILEMPEYGFQVTRLNDEQATRRAILAELHTLFDATPDFVCFYFAGHGIACETGTYLASIDTDSIDPGIDLDYLRRLAVSQAAGQTTAVILLDCCHSGAATARGSLLPGARWIADKDIANALLSLGLGRVVMAACLADQQSYEEPSLRHGVFTHYLLEGLYGDAADADGDITLPNLYDFVSRGFRDVTSQTPVFKGDIVGRIVLGRNLRPRLRAEIPEKEMRDLEAQAQDLMNEYIRGTSVDMDNWAERTYRDACTSLEPRLAWFESNLARYPQLKARPLFIRAYSTAKSKLADLGNLMEGVNTRLGMVEAKLGAGTFGTVWRLRQGNGVQSAYKAVID